MVKEGAGGLEWAGKALRKWEQFSDNHPTWGSGIWHSIWLGRGLPPELWPEYDDKESGGCFGQAGQTLREYWWSWGGAA